MKCVGRRVELGAVGHEVEVDGNDSSCYEW